MTDVHVDGGVAIVTGASSGVGEATVFKLAAQGWYVVALARSVKKRLWPFANIVNLACDVSQEEDVRSGVGLVMDRFGRIDALVNAAGILRPAPAGRVLMGDVDTQVAVNVYGTMRMVEQCLEPLRAAGGVIVNVSSTLVEHPAPGLSVYAATKGAVEAYTKSLALELAPAGVRVNAVRLGLVETGIHLAAGRSEEESEAIFSAGADRLPLGRVGTPEEAAESIFFLLSPAARWTTGISLVVDGGRSLG